MALKNQFKVFVFILILHFQFLHSLEFNFFTSCTEEDLIEYFDKMENSITNISEGKIAFLKILDTFQPKSTFCISELQKLALDIIDDFEISETMENQLKKIINDLLLQEITSFRFERSPFSKIFYLKGKNPNPDASPIPGSMVIGGIEILTGSLLLLVPGGTWLGRAAIADGIRRSFNGIEELDKRNQDKQFEFKQK